MPRAMTGRTSSGSSTRATRLPASGPIRHTGQRGTRRGSPTTACVRASIAGSRRAGRCRAGRRSPTRRSRGCARRSSTSSPDRRGRWDCSSAPSASPGRAPRSASPISPTTCSAWFGRTGELRPPDQHHLGRGQIPAPPDQKSDPDTATIDASSRLNAAIRRCHHGKRKTPRSSRCAPPSCQSRGRRQQAMPAPHLTSSESISHRMPVRTRTGSRSGPRDPTRAACHLVVAAEPPAATAQ